MVGRTDRVAGTPETAESARAALRRGLAGRGVEATEPVGGSRNGSTGRGTGGRSPVAGRRRRQDDEQKAKALEVVGDHELFDVDAADGVLTASENAGPVKRGGPAITPSG